MALLIATAPYVATMLMILMLPLEKASVVARVALTVTVQSDLMTTNVQQDVMITAILLHTKSDLSVAMRTKDATVRNVASVVHQDMRVVDKTIGASLSIILTSSW